jgi:hypothetical protein
LTLQLWLKLLRGGSEEEQGREVFFGQA